MNLVQQIKEKASKANKHIVLPEGADKRVVEASCIIANDGLARVTLLGDKAEIHATANELSLDISKVNIIDPANSDDLQRYASEFFQLRKHKGVSEEQALEIVKDPIYFGTMMLQLGDVDGLVAGALSTTADVLRPGLQIVKTAPGVSTVSSSFLMIVPNKEYGQDGVLMFADCAINIDPTPEQLADIAVATAATAKSVAGIEPKIAMLSYSTKGSGSGPMVDKVTNAVKILKINAPDLEVDGELQADAALVSSVAQLKSPDSLVAGRANVLVFPDIQSGNISYKLVERLGGVNAIGPICQGFKKPINDLSRGCSVKDIVEVTAITVLQASL